MKIILFKVFIGALYSIFIFLFKSENGQWTFGSLFSQLLIPLIPCAIIFCVISIFYRTDIVLKFLENQSELIDIFYKEFKAIIPYFIGYTITSNITALF